jgi:hypothetical protein
MQQERMAAQQAQMGLLSQQQAREEARPDVELDRQYKAAQIEALQARTKYEMDPSIIKHGRKSINPEMDEANIEYKRAQTERTKKDGEKRGAAERVSVVNSLTSQAEAIAKAITLGMDVEENTKRLADINRQIDGFRGQIAESYGLNSPPPAAAGSPETMDQAPVPQKSKTGGWFKGLFENPLAPPVDRNEGLAAPPPQAAQSPKWSAKDVEAVDHFTIGEGRNDPRKKIVLEHIKKKYGSIAPPIAK